VGFLVKDGASSVATFKTLGTKMELNASGRGGFFYTPDGLRLEMPERPTLAAPIVFDQIHFFVPEPAPDGKTMADMEAWYAEVFGAQPGQPGGNPATLYEAKILPGVNLRYSKNATPVAAIRGRALDTSASRSRTSRPSARNSKQQESASTCRTRDVPILGSRSRS
jgi:hypothetical protein